MAYVITGKGPAGCCACVPNADPCQCANQATLKCRTKSGLGEIKGFDEFPNPAGASTPPKKYTRLDDTGSMSSTVFNEPTCATVFHTVTQTLSGFCLFNRSTELVEDHTNVSTVRDGVSDPDVSAGCGVIAGEPGITYSATRTIATRSGTADCAGGGPKFVGTTVQTLSQEYTESDAISKLLAGLTWSAWLPAGTPCCAGWQARGSGFQFRYTELQYQVTVVGSPGSNVRVKVPFTRRPFGGGAFEDFGHDELLLQVRSDGLAESAINTGPNQRGWETCVGTPSIIA